MLFLLNFIDAFIIILIELYCNCYISVVSSLILGILEDMFISSFCLIEPPTLLSSQKICHEVEKAGGWTDAANSISKDVPCFMLEAGGYFPFCSCGETGRYEVRVDRDF